MKGLNRHSACARDARPHGWSGSGCSGKPAENHTKPATLLRLTWSDSRGRGGSKDYAAPESHAAARPPTPRKLQLPACPGRQPALLPDPEGKPLPFPPTPTPAQPQFPPSPQRRSGQLRRAFADRLRHGAARHPPPGSGSGSGQRPPLRHGTARPRRRCSVRPTRTPPSSSGLSPEPAGRLRSPTTGPVLRLGDCQLSSFPFTRVHQRGHKGDFFQREERVIKSEVHGLPFSFMKRERCEELCESRVTVLPENTSVPAGVRSTLDLVTRKVPSGSPKPLPKSGIKLLNTNLKLRSRHFVYRSAGDTGDRSSKGVSRLVSKSISFYRLFLSGHCYRSSFRKNAYYARS
ncbi:uncharacterized protein LOC142035125 [Buteo buteo]|uniref:uncharacterized protein LOC142035125 n=1 Tax=Buteo buteo TaxID=30397 RepID=UPI003EBB2BCE